MNQHEKVLEAVRGGRHSFISIQAETKLSYISLKDILNDLVAANKLQLDPKGTKYRLPDETLPSQSEMQHLIIQAIGVGCRLTRAIHLNTKLPIAEIATQLVLLEEDHKIDVIRESHITAYFPRGQKPIGRISLDGNGGITVIKLEKPAEIDQSVRNRIEAENAARNEVIATNKPRKLVTNMETKEKEISEPVRKRRGAPVRQLDAQTLEEMAANGHNQTGIGELLGMTQSNLSMKLSREPHLKDAISRGKAKFAYEQYLNANGIVAPTPSVSHPSAVSEYIDNQSELAVLSENEPELEELTCNNQIEIPTISDNHIARVIREPIATANEKPQQLKTTWSISEALIDVMHQSEEWEGLPANEVVALETMAFSVASILTNKSAFHDVFFKFIKLHAESVIKDLEEKWAKEKWAM